MVDLDFETMSDAAIRAVCPTEVDISLNEGRFRNWRWQGRGSPLVILHGFGNEFLNNSENIEDLLHYQS